MAWQKVVRHISDTRIVVESKSGKTYPVGTEYDRIGKGIYSQLGNINDANLDKTIWAWVDFEGESPVIEDTVPSRDGPPEKPPWERGA